jgi:hypothetical protein
MDQEKMAHERSLIRGIPSVSSVGRLFILRCEQILVMGNYSRKSVEFVEAIRHLGIYWLMFNA